MRPKRFGSLDVASRVEEGHPHRLSGLARVVVLDVELPGDPAPVEPVEDRRPGRRSLRPRSPGVPVTQNMWLATLPSVVAAKNRSNRTYSSATFQ